MDQALEAVAADHAKQAERRDYAGSWRIISINIIRGLEWRNESLPNRIAAIARPNTRAKAPSIEDSKPPMLERTVTTDEMTDGGLRSRWTTGWQ